MPFIKKTLEKILGEERTERLVNSEPYKFALETFVMNSFSYVTAASIELTVGGLDFYEHLKTRAAGLVTNTLFGRVYGMWRDYLFKKLKITRESSFAKKYVGDTLIFMTFMPIYFVNMAIGGVELDEMIRSALTATVVSGVLGGPYGLYLDFMRKQSGLDPEYLSLNKPEISPE